MECSICYDAISAATGQVTLACSHTYHLGCVGRWMLEHQTCPLCRAAPTEKERISAPLEEEEYEEEEDWGDDRSELDIPEFNQEAADARAADEALWVMRTTFENLEEDQLPDPEPLSPQVDVAWEVCLVHCVNGPSELSVERVDHTEERKRRRHYRDHNPSRVVEVARGGYESA